MSASVHAGIHTSSQEQTLPPEADTPSEQTPHRADTQWEQTPPRAVHAWRYGQQAGGMHPTGMQSCFHCHHFVNAATCYHDIHFFCCHHEWVLNPFVTQ